LVSVPLGKAGEACCTLRVLRKSLSIIFALSCLALLGYSTFRAYHLSFTHDESLTYSFVAGDPLWRGTANNHPLNTRLMTWMYRWLGQLEWHLRLPNVLAHVLYLTFGLLLLGGLRSLWTKALGFALFNLNPFLLDFFGLARGYGLALGLSMASLFFLRKAWDRTDLFHSSTFLLLSLTCASLADLLNYAWLNIHLPFAASLLILSLRHDAITVRLSRAPPISDRLKLNRRLWRRCTADIGQCLVRL
jgi:hypothetical protein